MNEHLLRRILILCLLALYPATASWSQTPVAATYKSGIQQGLIKVKFKQEFEATLNQTSVNARSAGFTTGIASLDATAKATKASTMYRLFPYDAKNEYKLRRHGLHLWYVVEIDKNTDPATAVAQFKQLGEVAVAEVEHQKILKPYAVTDYSPTASAQETLPFNDPMLKDQWHYNNTMQTGFGDADINLFEAWKSATGGNDIIVSVHDEGVDVKHADLKANIWVNQAELNGQPGVDDDGNGYVDDINGYNFTKNTGQIDAQYHGTHVSGTIAAVNNNGIGVSGIAGGNGSGNGVKIMSLEILGGAAIEKSYVYAANNGAVISQNSWGYSSPYYFDESVKDAIDYFVAEAGDYPGSPMKGGIVFFAAGNSNSSEEWYPGYYSSTFSVAAIGPEWKRAYYSNYGDWVELAAPGGDQDYGGIDGVLSTIPGDKYAYMQGTSMACPHVSGIAALALANRTRQLTNTELWNKLVTGVVPIDSYNEGYEGLLGSGSIDASLAIKNDQGKAPSAIADLAVTGIAQEFADFSWTVPADEDDGQPIEYTLYYHTEAITNQNLAQASKVTIKSVALKGESLTYELTDLLGLTQYYFAITSTDRWGNTSAISNVVNATTNEGPSISVDPGSLNLDIDVTISSTGSANLDIINGAAGILRWESSLRHKSASLSYNAAGLNYPTVTKTKSNAAVQLGRAPVHTQNNAVVKSNEPEAMSFTAIEKSMVDYPTNIIGETDLSLTNSAAAKFYVNETEGFNLTEVRMYLKHDPAKGPVIVEIYKGSSPTRENMVYAQEYSSYGDYETTAYVTLNEQLYFEYGTTFWVVFHIPANNLFPLGIGYETDPSYSANCLISFDLGATWTPLEDALASKSFAWVMTAASNSAYLGEYVTLEPSSGDINGNEQGSTTITADGSMLVNGTYEANVILKSNDAQQRELRVPVTVNVSGQKPKIKHIDIADFGPVFIGAKKTLNIELDNAGYGNMNDPVFDVTGSGFALEGYPPYKLYAREKATIQVSFTPSTSGNSNGMLTVSNGSYTYQVPLFAIGAETSKMVVTPETQVVNGLAIGDEVNAQVTVENTGAYPLKYFIPGYDQNGVSENWPSKYHKYGYKFRTNYASEASPIAYSFQDISSTGVDITSQLIQSDAYVTVDMGFKFPYYDRTMETIYIAQKGFTTFDNSVRPINSPSIPGNEWTPKGYISLLGTYLSYISQGHIYYQLEADRLIIQYDDVTDGWSGSVTAQMVLYANGNIRFYYDDVTLDPTYFSVLIEDYDQQDGILINNYDHLIDMYGGLALGLDYPGPNIITNIENGSGLLMPGQSAVVDVTMSTASLVEGTTNRYLNIISNDPANAQSTPLIQLEITSGGTAMPTLSTDNIDFGDVFQGAVVSKSLVIKNPGTASTSITSMTFNGSSFDLTGDHPTTIKPGLYKNYNIAIHTDIVTTLNDVLTINYADGSNQTVTLSGNVLDPPAINVDLSLIQQTLNYGETASVPFSIENTGLADLEISTEGKQWLSFESAAPITSATYTFEKNNTSGIYQWIDLLETGTHMPYAEDVFNPADFWHSLDLPFSFEFYGQSYDKILLGENGIVAFSDEVLQVDVPFFTDVIPTSILPGPCIMPYWTFGGFDTYTWPEEKVGIFYKTYDDKVIITWSYLANNFGGFGDPISAQMILYKNGTMKFQYRPEETGTDLTSQFTAIGLQENSTNGVSISDHLPLDHGNGLAYTVIPARKITIAPGTTLDGEIVMDATNTFGGIYNESLKINTNVPGSELLEKPVELTINGEGVLSTPAEVDFGSKIVALEWGSPLVNTMPVEITNSGTAPLDITWISMADGTQALGLQVYMLVDGWFGPEWQWSNISDVYSPWYWPNPSFTLMPGDKLNARVTFAPADMNEFMDEIVFTTSVGEVRMTVKGTGVLPPAMEVDTTPIEISMNTLTETATPSIVVGNTAGQSDLTYEVSIDYGRAGATRAESVSTSAAAVSSLSSIPAKVTPTAKASLTYNRTISHTDATEPESFVGTGGAAPFTLATKFKAGADGFNLSHVETWFRVEDLASGTVEVEIRAGSEDIANAEKLAEGILDFSSAALDEVGAWYTIALTSPAGIYPNEEFYVVITYPLGISYPQGIITDDAVEGRYLYNDEGVWYDLQNESSFATTGWLMYVGEETAGNSSWISVTSSTSASVAAGESGSVDLLIEGPFAQHGDQVANVIITSNDPNNPEVHVPVSLHVNEAPFFTNIPESIVIAEGEEYTVDISVVDVEGNTITLADATYPGVSHTFNGSHLVITFSPDFGDAGNYEYVYNATDEYNASRELKLPVEVMHTNRAPVYVNSESALNYYSTGKNMEYTIGDFYADPDGDDMTFSVTSMDHQLVDVFTSASGIIIRPIEPGETSLIFNVNDGNGGITKDTISVVVNVVLGVGETVNNGLSVYPNPVEEYAQIFIEGDWRGPVQLQVVDALGRKFIEHAEEEAPRHEIKIPVSSLKKGVYILHAVSDNKEATVRLIKK